MRHRTLSLGSALFFIVGVLSAATPASAAWISAYAGNFSGISGYTQVNVVNVGKKEETVTVRFMNQDATEVASTSQLLQPGEGWTVSSSDGFTGAVSTGDFSGYVRIENTASDKKVAVFGMVAFPVDGSGAIGNSLAISAVALNFVRAK